MNRKHAIVIGASIAGLSAAKVLSQYFEKVTIIERDALPWDAPKQSRPGVAQGNHPHLLLAAGEQVVREYFPKLMEELTQEGAIRGDAIDDVQYYSVGGWKLRFKSNREISAFTRPFFENKVAKFVRALPNVTFLENYNTIEPIYDAKQKKVTGVKIENIDTEQVSTLEGDLVLDASGRNSISPQWLRSWGYTPAIELKIVPDVAYSTFCFERRPRDIDGRKLAVAIASDPPVFRRGLASAIEGDQWIVTLVGNLGDHAPQDLEGFREYARSLTKPDIYNLVKDRQPTSKNATFKLPFYRRNLYEKLSEFPFGYLLLGDAICNFNPIYGQGMSTALLEAKALDDCLKQGDQNLAQRFFQKASKIIDMPWKIATLADLAMPKVEGPRSFTGKLFMLYMRRVNKAAEKDPVVMMRFSTVTNLLMQPSSLFAPNILWRVLLRGGK